MYARKIVSTRGWRPMLNSKIYAAIKVANMEHMDAHPQCWRHAHSLLPLQWPGPRQECLFHQNSSPWAQVPDACLWNCKDHLCPLVRCLQPLERLGYLRKATHICTSSSPMGALSWLTSILSSTVVSCVGLSSYHVRREEVYRVPATLGEGGMFNAGAR